MLDQIASHGAECIVSGNEVGFAVQLNNGSSRVVLVETNFNPASFGCTLRTLFGILQPTLTRQQCGLLDIPFGFLKQLLAFHQTKAGNLTKLIDDFGGNICHVLSPDFMISINCRKAVFVQISTTVADEKELEPEIAKIQ